MVFRRRLLTSLASHTSNLGRTSATATPLLPPYSHQNVSAPSLKPPYDHTLQAAFEATQKVNRLHPRQRFSVVPGTIRKHGDREEALSAWQSWADEKLGSEAGRQEVLRAWEAVLKELETFRQSPTRIPEIAFHSVATQLRSPSILQTIQETGVLIVRDVIPDVEAISWARDVLESSVDRSSPVYWHRALLEARSHSSLIATHDRVLSALRNEELECMIRAEGVQESLSASARTLGHHTGPWNTADEITAHLCLTPSFSPQASVQTSIYPSIHAAVYATLRPLFRPINSRISFYQSQTSNYLQASNWSLINDSTSASRENLPHLDDGFIPLPSLNPGDIVYRHSALPVRASAPANEEVVHSQLFLPVNPLVPTPATRSLVEEQKKAFEAGLPPPSARLEGGTISLEEKGKKELISSHGGRRAMGY